MPKISPNDGKKRAPEEFLDLKTKVVNLNLMLEKDKEYEQILKLLKTEDQDVPKYQKNAEEKLNKALNNLKLAKSRGSNIYEEFCNLSKVILEVKLMAGIPEDMELPGDVIEIEVTTTENANIIKDDTKEASDDSISNGSSIKFIAEKRKWTRGEKHARATLLKTLCDLEQLANVYTVLLRKSDGLVIKICEPDVFFHETTGTYLVFGEFKGRDIVRRAEVNAAALLKYLKKVKLANVEGNNLMQMLKHIKEKQEVESKQKKVKKQEEQENVQEKEKNKEEELDSDDEEEVDSDDEEGVDSDDEEQEKVQEKEKKKEEELDSDDEEEVEVDSDDEEQEKVQEKKKKKEEKLDSDDEEEVDSDDEQEEDSDDEEDSEEEVDSDYSIPSYSKMEEVD